ncbi:methyltransferase domain-containing protein [Dyella sp. KRB-257]|uniref:class I SAM-dependent methyltransferase n=1 Tax=Dyella sp. KRB-257 TaxID=3400915 RepID=UPI00086D2903|nr:MAG: methyltransferase type 11 [Rhodanobacter sp. SCN 65-17]
MITSMPERRPHAVLDAASRSAKALKIERLLNLVNRPQPLRLLEIGTGSGGIAQYFADHDSMRCEVVAVDVVDNRSVSDGYEFHLVKGVALPFADANFDVVISNHVIEHVGDVSAQAQHLSEIRRVMKQDGVGYLAVPNRWMLTEPHYRLMFLSWLPEAWRTPYLRAMHRGENYDCVPLTVPHLERLLGNAGFKHRNLSVEALRATFEIERPYTPGARLLRALPDTPLRMLRRLIPTLIYELHRPDNGAPGRG